MPMDADRAIFCFFSSLFFFEFAFDLASYLELGDIVSVVLVMV